MGPLYLLVLAKDNQGLENIFRMQEIAYVYNFYRKPRINWDILREHHEGLIVTSACLGSTFNQLIVQGDILGATNWARKFKDLFGEDFYIEIQPNSLPEQYVANTGAIRIARQLGIKLVATGDVHYTYESDAFPHEVMLAMQVKKKMSDENRFRFTTNDYWIKSEEEMVQTFSNLPQDAVHEAIVTTREIANKCSARIESGHYLPKFYDVPEGRTERELLVKNVMVGARERGLATDRAFMQDVQREIDVIDRNGYSGYFLIVQDYVTSAKRNGILVGDGRGSGAGSKVAYLTGITEIPPHEFDLLFERFMADGRTPDFDVDFSDQDGVFTDLQHKYGVENVARVVAFGTLTPKAAVRKVLNTFDHPMSEQNAISKLIPDEAQSLAQAFEMSPDLEHYRRKFKTEFDVIERLEGVISHESMHAGGVIIYPDLSRYVPIKTISEDRSKRIVAWDKYMLEDLGHYKFDVLGLETLPTVRRTLDSIRETTGEDIDLNRIDYEDPEVYAMLCKGDVSGVFQLANQAQKVMEQRPKDFRDLIAINALIRPGTGDWVEYTARRKGKTWTVHPDRLPYLKETEGLITYQEQFLLDCKTIAGWDIAFADKKVRKNKDIRNDEELRNQFIADAVARGYDETDATSIWKEIEDSVAGGYSFNKSHSASYARLSYQTAWLKCHYPQHFYASLMSSEKTDGGGQDAIAGYIAECKQRGIQILPPDIRYSAGDFLVSGDGIQYRITTIKHVGQSAIDHIEYLRPIGSFADFMARREKSIIKQNVLVNLIKAGCFDFDNPNRAELLWQVDRLNRTKTQIKKGYEPPQYEWNDRVKAEWERDVLGMYLSVHPMERYGFRPFSSYAEGSQCIAGGEVYDMRVFNDKNGNEMAFVWINTLFGNVKVTIFQSTWSKPGIQEVMQMYNLVLVRGRKQGDGILLDSAEVLE